MTSARGNTMSTITTATPNAGWNKAGDANVIAKVKVLAELEKKEKEKRIIH